MNPQEIEESLIKKIFQITIDSNEKQYIYLPQLAQKLTSLPVSFDFSSIVVPSHLLGSGSTNFNSQSSSVPVFRAKLNCSYLDAIVQEKIHSLGASSAFDKVFFYIGTCLKRITEEKTLGQKKNDQVSLKVVDESEKCIYRNIKLLFLSLQTFPQNISSAINQFFSLWDSLPTGFLGNVLQTCLNPTECNSVVLPMYMVVASEFRRTTRGKNLTLNEHVNYLKYFFNLTQEGKALQVLSAYIVNESKLMLQNTAREIELRSFLAAFLGMTCILSRYDNNAFNYFPSMLPNYPDGTSRSDFQLLQKSIQTCLKQGIDCVHAVMKKLFLFKEYPESKENLLQWLCNFLRLNESKLQINPKDNLSYELYLTISTDGFLLNLVNVLFQFCKPFLNPEQGKLKTVDSNYFTTFCRFDFSKTPKLCDHPDSFTSKESFSSSSSSSNSTSPSLNFITEIYFITYYAIHIGLIPLIEEHEKLYSSYSRLYNSAQSLKAQYGDPTWKTTPDGKQISDLLNKHKAFLDSIETQLTEQDFLETTAAFCQFSILWILSFKLPESSSSEVPYELRKQFASFPEFVIKDIAEALLFLLRFKPEVVLSLPNLLQYIINWAVLLLDFPSLVKSPIIRSKLSNLLSEIIYKKQAEEEHFNRRGAWGSLSAVGQQFYFAFQNNKLAQTELAPGLMMIYVDVDIVEGLDVDKEQFDKYNIRRGLALLLNDMWKIPIFRASFKKASQSGQFGKFIGTVVNDLIHLLDDSLNRLIDIKQLQIAMEDKNEWNNQDPEFKKEREKYYESQETVSRGFLSLANSVLDLLLQLAGEEDLIPFFMESKMVIRTEAMLNHFFDVLCGPKCTNLKVKNPEKYGFSPKDLLRKITTLTSCFISSTPFIEAMAKDPDYSPDIMKQVIYYVNRERILDPTSIQNFEKFISTVNQLILSPSTTNLSFNQPSNNNNENTDKMEEDRMSQSESMELGPSMDEAELEKIYIEELRDYLFDEVSMMNDEGTKYLHHYANNIQGNSSSPAKITKLQKEFQVLPTSLPLNLNSSVFVRYDSERIDLVKAIIIGPKDTPYALGCFLFDIYFPPSYPNDPPLVNLQTTGNGTVRFNPNLYNCGKVCLSLLGTWHGDNQTSKWNPSTSSLYQVLVSIQALILVDHPYFNEPAYEAQRGTKEGDLRTAEYNDNIRLATLRFAMIEPLQNPSRGFEHVIQTHFKLQKYRILQQCTKWTEESNENKAKFQRSFEVLKQELDKLH